MSTKFEEIKEYLKNTKKSFLLTGGAGFIGSNILEALLSLGQKVIVVDDLSTGYQKNIDEVVNNVGENAKDFKFIKGDIRDYDLIKDMLKESQS